MTSSCKVQAAIEIREILNQDFNNHYLEYMVHSTNLLPIPPFLVIELNSSGEGPCRPVLSLNINQLRIFRINIVTAGYLCLSTKGGWPPPRSTSVPSEHMSDLALGWPAASERGGSAAGVCAPRYNYRHQLRIQLYWPLLLILSLQHRFVLTG